METGLLHLHSFLRWVILLLLLVAILRSAMNINGIFTSGDRKIGLFLMITCDIMLLIGLYQWFTGPWGMKAIESNGMKGAMADAGTRFFAVEHFVGMLLAIILVHIGKSWAKKQVPDSTKHRRTLLFYTLALVIILISIPWPFREVGATRGWF